MTIRWYNRVALRCGQAFFKHLWRVEVRGLEHYPADSARPLVIVANHQSLLDPPLMTMFLPEPALFPVNMQISQWWLFRFIRAIGGHQTYAIDQANPLALRGLIRQLQAQKELGSTSPVCIFPEGRLTRTGKLMKAYDGAGMIADKLDALIVQVRFDGLEMASINKLRVSVPWRRVLRPKVTMTIQPPVEFDIPAGLRGRERRKKVAAQLRRLLAESAYNAAETQRTLFGELLTAAHKFGFKQEILQDISFVKLSYAKLILGAVVLGRRLRSLHPQRPQEGETIGLMLPSANGAAVSFFAAQYAGLVPAMINVTAGTKNILSGCTAAQITTIYTSRVFVEKGAFQALVGELIAQGQLQVRYLEDIRTGLGLWDKLSGAVVARWLRLLDIDKAFGQGCDKTAVVLFTSGSEGTPKGVALSHRNLLANRAQIASMLDFGPADKLLNALPLFHSFGLGVGLLLPIFEGVKLFLYPSPLHFRMVPEMIYDVQATIVFGTDTFLSRYGQYAHAYDFWALRLVFAGAEKLRESTRVQWQDKFGVRILEGYGTTEASPVVAINTPMEPRLGSVGRLVPGLAYRLEPVPGIERADAAEPTGRLYIRGANVMRGYLKADQPGILRQDGVDDWYDTGDVVRMDADGFVRIVGRVKRFAKIAGEMISLQAVEDFIEKQWAGGQHAVVALPDARRGERLVLVTTRDTLTRATLLATAQRAGLSELWVPREIVDVETLPLLGSGKPDYPAIKKLVEMRLVAGGGQELS